MAADLLSAIAAISLASMAIGAVLASCGIAVRHGQKHR